MDPPLRVLRVCSVFESPASALSGGAKFDPIGGMQEHTGSLTRVLARRGVVQVVLTTRPPTAPWIERRALGTTVIRVGLPVGGDDVVAEYLRQALNGLLEVRISDARS